MQNLIGRAVPDDNLRKVASLAMRLYSLQPTDHHCSASHEDVVSDTIEFGADLVFQAPARFLVDDSLEYGELFADESIAPSSSLHKGWHNHMNSTNYHSVDVRDFNLSWLRDACDLIVTDRSSVLSRDDLAMAICRVLDSEKPGEEVTSR